MRVEPIRDMGIIKECLNYLEARNKRDYLMFATGIYTGLRVSDILKLRVRDIYNKNRLDVKQTKTKEVVYIPVNPKLKKIVKKYVEENNLQSYDYLFKSREGLNKPISRNQAYNVLSEMAKYIGLENIGTHTMRKTAGYHLYYASGKDIGLVMQVLGHKDMHNTLRYIGVTQMDIESNIKKLCF